MLCGEELIQARIRVMIAPDDIKGVELARETGLSSTRIGKWRKAGRMLRGINATPEQIYAYASARADTSSFISKTGSKAGFRAMARAKDIRFRLYPQPHGRMEVVDQLTEERTEHRNMVQARKHIVEILGVWDGNVVMEME